ncbi:unnamed protein product [Arabidopsis thaliana]|uniref:Uncharacterized protein n=1 Tax=Arabidopsis thaliana TaxID=3702 RepID=A0A654G5W3_ARATH|nr:unnamed protein product [Arabidopsis thaliana]
MSIAPPTIDRLPRDPLCKLFIVLPKEKHIEESHVSTKMNNLNKSKEPPKGDIIVEVGETSRSCPNKHHSPLHNVQRNFSCDDKLRAKGVQLYQAALKGDWKAANGIIIEQKDIIYQKITSKSETVLHIAVAAKHEGFVRNLLGSLESNDLALRNVDGNTALCFAAASGVVEIAKMLIEKNKDLPMIRGGGETTPIHMAALFGHGEMVKYLYKNTRFREFNDEEFVNLFHAVISADIYVRSIHRCSSGDVRERGKEKSTSPLDKWKQRDSLALDGSQAFCSWP